MRKVGSNAGSVNDIKETELKYSSETDYSRNATSYFSDKGVGLQEERQRLADTTYIL